MKDLSLSAYYLAVKAHEGQTRRDGETPYIKHIEAVVSRLDTMTSTTIDMAVAALHDIREETPYSYSEIKSVLLEAHPDEEEAIDEIIDGIKTLTKKKGEDYRDFIHRIATHDGGRWAPIKVADILANLSDAPTLNQIRKYAAALLILTEEME